MCVCVCVPDHFDIIMQVTQVFVAKKWVRNARDEINVEAHSRANAERALGALKEEHAKLAKKLKEAESARLSVEADLKTTEAQAEDQRKKLYTIELELATQK